MTIAPPTASAPIAAPLNLAPPPNYGQAASSSVRQTQAALTANGQANFQPQQLPQQPQISTQAQIRFVSQGSAGAQAVVPSETTPVLNPSGIPQPPRYGAPIVLNNPAPAPFIAQFLGQSNAVGAEDFTLFQQLTVQATPLNAKQQLQAQQQEQQSGAAQVLRDMRAALGEDATGLRQSITSTARPSVPAFSAPSQQSSTPAAAAKREAFAKVQAARSYAHAQSRLDISSQSTDTIPPA